MDTELRKSLSELVEAADQTFRCSETQKREYVRQAGLAILSETSREYLKSRFNRLLDDVYLLRKLSATGTLKSRRGAMFAFKRHNLRAVS